MKKLLLVISLIFVLATLIIPLRATAAERITATLTSDNLYLKEGPVNATWQQLTSGVGIIGPSLAGDRISILDDTSSNKTVSIKEPAWNSPWNMTHWGAPLATDQVVSQLSDGQYRLLVLRADGSVVMKDGPWNTGWWSGTIEPSGVARIAIGGDRIAVIMTNGDLKVKHLTPGQFSHPNNVSWTLVSNNVFHAEMTNTRLATTDTDMNVYAKDGDLTAPWFGDKAKIYDNINNIYALHLGGDRICVHKMNGSVECKEGGLGTGSILTFSCGEPKANATRVAVIACDTNAYVLEGSLHGPNSGWQWIGTGNIGRLDLN